MSLITRAWEWLKSLRHIVLRHHLTEWFTVVICLTGIALGGDMVRDPRSYAVQKTFAVALGPDGWAQPQVWGLLLIIPCAATLLALAARRRDIYWPLAAVTFWLSAWAWAILQGAPDPDAVGSALIVYTALTTITASLAAVYLSEGRGNRE